MSDDLHCGSSSSTLVNGRLDLEEDRIFDLPSTILPTSSNNKKRSDGVRRSNCCRLDSDGRSDLDMYVPYICTQQALSNHNYRLKKPTFTDPPRKSIDILYLTIEALFLGTQNWFTQLIPRTKQLTTRLFLFRYLSNGRRRRIR
jgi:hypothetical protein